MTRIGEDVSQRLDIDVGAGAALEPLYEVHKRLVLSCPVLHADETPVSMLDPGAGKTKRAYIWAYAQGELDAQGRVMYASTWQRRRLVSHSACRLLQRAHVNEETGGRCRESMHLLALPAACGAD